MMFGKNRGEFENPLLNPVGGILSIKKKKRNRQVVKLVNLVHRKSNKSKIIFFNHHVLSIFSLHFHNTNFVGSCPFYVMLHFGCCIIRIWVYSFFFLLLLVVLSFSSKVYIKRLRLTQEFFGG